MISAILAFQIAFGSSALLFPTRAVAAERSSAQQASDAFSDDIDNFEKLTESGPDTPPPASKDRFQITRQKITDYKTGATYSLAQKDTRMPSLIVTDPSEIHVGTDNVTGDLLFDIIRNGRLVFEHRIQGTNVRTWTRDAEILVFLDYSGQYHAIDMGFARTQLGRNWIPVAPLVRSGIDFQALKGEVSLSQILKSQKPFVYHSQYEDGVHPQDSNAMDQENLRAGNYVLTVQENGQDLKLEELDRGVVRSDVFATEFVLSGLATRLDPDVNKANKQLYKKIAEDQAVLSQVANAYSEASIEVSSVLAEAIGTLNSDGLKALGARALGNLKRIHEPRDQFSYEEWKSHYLYMNAEVQDKAKEEKKAQKKRFKALWDGVRRTLTPKALKNIALITAGTTASYFMLDAFHEGYGPAWAVYATNNFLDHHVPAVLKDTSYRVTLLAGSLIIGSLLPLVYVAGAIGGMALKKKWSASRMVALAAFRFTAEISLLFIHRIAQVFRQQSAIKAMQLGLNPFVKVAADSPEGQALGLKRSIRPGLNNPLWSKKKHGVQSAVKAEALRLLALKESRVQRLKWMLAVTVVSHEMGIDVATLTVLAKTQGIAMTKEAVERFILAPEFDQHCRQVAFEIGSDLPAITGPEFQMDIQEIPQEELGKLYRSAKAIAEKIEKRGAVLQRLKDVQRIVTTTLASTNRNLANYGLEEDAFLRNGGPDDYTADQSMKQFVLDYPLAIVQIGLFGPRADLDRPKLLAADPNGFLLQNRQHGAELVDQVRIYGLGVPAGMGLVYQRAEEVVEMAYAPMENKALVGTVKTEGVGRGMWAWLRGATDIRKADYGKIWMKKLVRGMKTIQSGFILSMFSRIVVAGQPYNDAFGAFVYSIFMGNWLYGWMWDPNTYGNQTYQDHLGERRQLLENAKANLGLGIRMDDPMEMRQGLTDMKGLYGKGKKQIPADLSMNIDRALEEFEKLSEEERLNLSTRAYQSARDVAALRYAVSSGQEDRIVSARINLMDAYQESGADLGVLMKLTSVQLLEHSMKNPPFASKHNGAVEWITTLFFAFATTYLGTIMSVDLFRTDIEWWPKIRDGILIGGALYTGTYYLPEGLDLASKAWKKAKKGACALFAEGRLPPADAWEP